MRRAGFSLLEVLVTVTLAGLVLGLGLKGLGPGAKSSASTQGLAEEIAGVLQSARQRAISGGAPIAVGFPSAGGTSPRAGGYYLMEGEDHPRIVESRRFDAGYGEVAAFLGTWGNPVAARPKAWANGDDFKATAWYDANKKDFRLVFTPSGTVFSNLGSLGGAYRIVVSDGATFAGWPATLQSAGKPRTVSVSTAGTVEILPGVVPSGGVQELPQAVQSSERRAVPDEVTNIFNGNPSFVGSIQVQPNRGAAIVPPGVDGLVSLDGQVTLVARATDEQGGPLFSSWEGPGTFSSPGEVRMEWKNNAWESTWTWSPPETVTPGEIITLVCRVRDPQGNSVTSDQRTSPSILVSSGGRILAEYLGGSPTEGQNFDLLSPQGEVLVRPKIPNPQSSPMRGALTEDGQGIVYTLWTPYPSIVYCSIDGKNSRTIFTGSHPALDETTGTVAFVSGGCSWGNLDGTLLGSYSPPGHSTSMVDKHGNQIVSLSYGGDLIWFLTDSPSATVATIVQGINSEWAPRFSPDGTKVAYRGGGGDIFTVEVNPAPTGLLTPTQITTSGGVTNFDWSPDGASMVFYRGSRLWVREGGVERQVSNTDYGYAYTLRWSL